ncbi:3-dehydroquinate synthase, partial [Mesorhizobium sp. M7A.F.Ca.CA.002.04.1.1]|uniref:3-dehydroquinate synthase family protein n=1 Tax=Mesorhizobium sp. M7A.F.Ca.CA.002.04.1.1 TaxID=2496681 RepID=UPI001FE108BC
MSKLISKWNYPTTVRFGAGRIKELPEVLAATGIKRPLFVTDPGLAKLPVVASTLKILDDAKVPYGVFSEVRPNPVESNLTAGIAVFKKGKHDGVIAFGGGVIGDLAGFAAGIVRRGMNFVQIPTSLLAQVDSSVGGKTGINSPRGKNLVGVFHQPKLVLADTGVLDTLPIREFRAGYAELAKYGLIDRPEFFAWLEKNWVQVFAGGPERAQAIAEACRAKADVVARDEFETGDRALLNLGHTFGHALEAATQYDGSRLVHGEGVAIGMALAYRFSSRLNLASPDDAARVEAHLRAVGLPWRIADIPGDLPDAEALLAFITQDKKVSRGIVGAGQIEPRREPVGQRHADGDPFA